MKNNEFKNKNDHELVVYTKVNLSENNEIQRHNGIGKRHVQILILVLALAVMFIIRSQVSVAIVAMTSEEGSVNKSAIVKTFKWNKAKQETIIGSFFFGYVFMQIPCSLLSQRFGGKTPLLVGLVSNGLISLTMPWIVQFGDWQGACAARFFQGFTQAALFPCTQAMLGKWAPNSEKARLSSIVYSGAHFGILIGYPLAGWISASDYGWPMSFWVIGGICLTFAILFALLASSSPSLHSSITETEKNYILGHKTEENEKRKLKVPWKSIVTSLPVWGVIISQAGSSYNSMIILTETPVYLKEILHVDIKTSGVLSSIPYVVSFFASLVFGLLSDYLVNHKIISVINARRLANSLSMYVPAVCLVLFTFTSSTTVAVILQIIILASKAALHVGYMLNQIDLSPNYCGQIMSIGNFIASVLGGLGAPALVSLIVKDVKNQQQWQIVFGLAAAFNVICNTLFIMFIKVDKQKWDTPKYK